MKNQDSKTKYIFLNKMRIVQDETMANFKKLQITIHETKTIVFYLV